MKIKIITLFSICSLIVPSVDAQIVNLLNENFNSGFPVGWIAIDGDQKTPAAAVSNIGSSFSTHIDYDTLVGGDSILVATSWFNPVGKANNYLILPALTMQANGNFLHFEAKSKDPSYPEAIEVLVSTTTSDTINFTDTLYFNTLLSPNWTQYIFDLDAYVGQTIFIAIHHYSNDKFILCLDNFVVFADLQNTISEQENSEPLITVYPNPASDLLSLQSDSPIQSIRIFDISGRAQTELVTVNYSFNHQFSIADLVPGTYFLEVWTESGRVVRTFLKS